MTASAIRQLPLKVSSLPSTSTLSNSPPSTLYMSLLDFWKGKNASRKFIDLIWKSSTKYAVWDPAYAEIQVGDYGALDKDTGHFEKAGNIFRTPELEHLVRDHQQPSIKDDPKSDNVMTITSLNAKKVDIDTALSVNAQVAQASFKSGWKFGERTGAVLVVHQPRYVTLPPEMDFKALTKHPVLHEMFLVTNLTTCPAYLLYLATKEDKGISLALCVQPPVGLAPVTAGPTVTTSWVTEHGGGFYREGTHSEHRYTVLFDLKRCRKEKTRLFRESLSPERPGISDLDTAYPPWGMIDEDGEEEDIDFSEYE